MINSLHGRRVQEGHLYLYEEIALEESFFNILWVALFPFVQAPQPIVAGRVVPVTTFADFCSNTKAGNGGLPVVPSGKLALTLGPPSHR